MSTKMKNPAFVENGLVSTFVVPKMDCPSEEALIRMQLDGIEPNLIMEFDIPNRVVRVFHRCSLKEIEQRLHNCGLGATVKNSRPVEHHEWNQSLNSSRVADKQEAGTLKLLLTINAFMFCIELAVGWVAQSTGLIADSIDMFADATVYGLALIAVGQSTKYKLRAAHLSGWFQIILAFGVLSEVLRRYIFGSDPVSLLMMGMGGLALIANISCLLLIFKKKDSGAHMRASWIFSANDVIANLGVIFAGLLVAWTGSRYPDLVIGLIICIVVLTGAVRILKLRA